MPWTADDAMSHTHKADTSAKRHQWASVANKVLAESGDEAKAVRVANAAVAEHPSRLRKITHAP